MPEVSAPLETAATLLLEPSFKHEGVWHELPSRLADVQRDASGVRVEVVIGLPPSVPEKAPIGVHVAAHAVQCDRGMAHETEAMIVPKGASLEFSFGLARGSSKAAPPVRFSIDACEQTNCSTVFDEIVDPQAAASAEWADRIVDLEAMADKNVRFIFQTEAAAAADAPIMPVWGDPVVYARADRREDPPPNVVLISLDTLSARHLKPYGYAHQTTPFLDDTFGENGTIFEHAVAAATSTSPSHMTMFTGRQPSVNGVTTGVEVLPTQIPTITEIIRAAGLATAAVTEDGWLAVQHGFGRGFGTYVENKSPDIMQPTGQIDRTLDKAIAWLGRNANRHFFLFIHTFQVHDPFTPPQEYAALFPTVYGHEVTANSPRHLLEHRAYDQEIRYADDELKRLFATLRNHDLDENTVVIVVSDHGEEFGEHGWIGHGAHLFEEVSRVPLMFWGKGIGKKRRIVDPVGHADLAPTILELLRLTVPAGVQGRSLVPILADGPQHLEPRPYFTESWGAATKNVSFEPIDFVRPAFAVRLGDRKLARYKTNEGFRFEYYDLFEDPLEWGNLYAQRQQEVADLERLLTHYEADCAAAHAEAIRATASPKNPDEPTMDPRQLDKLRALGYLD